MGFETVLDPEHASWLFFRIRTDIDLIRPPKKPQSDPSETLDPESSLNRIRIKPENIFYTSSH